MSEVPTEFYRRALEAACPADHVYKVALYNEARMTDLYTTSGEITGEGYKAGGQTLSGRRVESDEEGAALHFNDAEWLNADIRAGAALYYDATTGDVIRWAKFGRPSGVLYGLFTVYTPKAGVVRFDHADEQT